MGLYGAIYWARTFQVRVRRALCCGPLGLSLLSAEFQHDVHASDPSKGLGRDGNYLPPSILLAEVQATVCSNSSISCSVPSARTAAITSALSHARRSGTNCFEVQRARHFFRCDADGFFILPRFSTAFFLAIEMDPIGVWRSVKFVPLDKVQSHREVQVGFCVEMDTVCLLCRFNVSFSK